MLVEFSVGNFRSFHEPVTLSMQAAKLRASDTRLDRDNVFQANGMRLLRSAAVYGANASGKSNLVRAISFMRRFVLESSRESQAEEPIRVDRFRLSTAARERPAHFQIVFFLDGVRYRYGFEVDERRVRAEWLYHACQRETRLFVREGDQFDLSGVSTDDAATLVVLPCRRFTFLPESTELTLESRRILDDCVLPTLSQSVGLFLRVKGSAAWPGPPGTYTEEEILTFAEARAQSVVDYLASQGIDRARFIVEGALPPEEHRETEDAELQAEDRYVEMTLITVGR